MLPRASCPWQPEHLSMKSALPLSASPAGIGSSGVGASSASASSAPIVSTAYGPASGP